MKVDGEDKEERLKAQKEAQKRLEEKKVADKENRLKELEAAKEAAMLKKASAKKSVLHGLPCAPLLQSLSQGTIWSCLA